MDDTSNHVTEGKLESESSQMLGLRILSPIEHRKLYKIRPLKDEEKEAIAIEFCLLENVDPYRVVRVDLSNNLAYSYKEMPYWETLLPEIERMYNIHALIHKYVG